MGAIVAEGQIFGKDVAKEIDRETFVAKKTEARDWGAALRLQLEVDRQHDEVADLAVKAIDISQGLTERRGPTDIAAKRRILEGICLNFRLDGATLYATMRKPFDIAAEWLFVQSSLDDWICGVWLGVQSSKAVASVRTPHNGSDHIIPPS